MVKTIHKWLSRLLMTLIALAVGVPLSQAAVTVNVKTNSGKTPVMYAWYDNNGTQKPLGDFPGRTLSPVSDFKGGTYYSITIETGGGNLNFILSNGEGQQTGNIENLNNDGYCYTYEWNGYSDCPLVKCERIAGVPSISPGFSFNLEQNGKVIYFVGEPWEVGGEKKVWAYTWSGSGNDAVKYSGDWPGTEMTLDSQQGEHYCYKLVVPNGSPVNVIFNNGNNGQQTGDLPFDDGGVYDRANLLMVATGVDIDYTDDTAIPEIELRRALKQHDPNNDGKITDFERLHATQAGFNYRWDYGSELLDEVQYLAGITNLTWLKNFPNATSLEVVYFNGGSHDDYREIGHFAFEEDKAYEGHNFKQGNLGAVSLDEFPLLTDVAIVGAKVTSIDLSKNPSIETLDLCGNSLQAINLANLSNLKSLEIDFNQLSSIDVSQNSNLQSLSISGNPINSSLTVSNSNLQSLIANKCGLTGLTLTTPALTKLISRYNSLTGLNVGGLGNLENLYVDNNQIVSINLANNSNLINLNVSHNALTSLDLTGTKVDDVRCAANQLTNLTLVSTVQDIDCSNNLLSNIDLSMISRLDKTVCFSKNNFSSLDFSNIQIVERLNVAGNHLTTLNLGSNNWEGFGDLSIANNDFTSLDLTSLIPYIEDLIACGNHFTDGSLVLPTVTYTPKGDGKDAPRRKAKRNAGPSVIHKAFDPSEYEGIDNLQIDNNEFTTFDFSGMPYMRALSCSGNQMTAIDLSNQHNQMEDAETDPWMSNDIASKIAIDWNGDYYDYLDQYCDQYGLTQAELIQRETDEFICNYGVNAPWPEYGDLGAGNTRALVAEWAQKDGNDIYFIRLDNNAAGTLGTINAADHLGSEFDLTKVTAWTNATVTNDATYGNILLLDVNNQSVDYAYSTGHTVEDSGNAYKLTTFNFTWTAPATPTIEEVGPPVAPEFSINGGAVRYGTRVYITNATDDADEHRFYYTTDGTDPRTSGTSRNYKDFLRITEDVTYTFTHVATDGVTYCDPVTVSFTILPQNDYSFRLVTSENDLVAGKNYLIVAKNIDTHNDLSYYAMSLYDEYDSHRYTYDSDIVVENDAIELIHYYTAEPYRLEGTTGAWKFATTDPEGEYIDFTAPGENLPSSVGAAASITIDNDATALIDFGTKGYLTKYDKQFLTVETLAEMQEPNMGEMYIQLYVQQPNAPELSLADGTVYTVYNGSQTNVTITAMDGSSSVSYSLNGGETQTASSPATVTLPAMNNYTGVTLEAWTENDGVESAHANATYTYVTPLTEEMAYTRIPNNEEGYTLLTDGRVVAIGSYYGASGDDYSHNKFFTAVPVGKNYGESEIVIENGNPASRGVSVFQYEGYNLKTFNTQPGAAFDEFTLEDAQNGDGAFYMRSRHVNDNNEPLYLNLIYDDDDETSAISYGTTPQALYFRGNNVGQRMLISNYPLPAQGETDQYSDVRATLTFSVGDQVYAVNSTRNIELPTLYVKTYIPGPPTLNPSTTQYINPESEQKRQYMETGQNGSYVVYLTQEEYDQMVQTIINENGRIDASCYHITPYSWVEVDVPTNKSTKYYAASVSEFGVMSDLVSVEYIYSSVVVPMPTFNPAPGTYRGDYLDIEILRAEGHENDRVFFTVAKNSMPADPTTNDQEYTNHKFRVNDGSLVIVKAVAYDSQGNRSDVNTGEYIIREDMPFDFRRANSLADLVPGREFIFLYENDDNNSQADYDDYGVMSTTLASDRRMHEEVTHNFDLSHFVEYIVGGDLLVIDKYLGDACMVKNNAAIFQLGKVGEKYTFYEFNSKKYLASTANGVALVDDASTSANAQFLIDIDANTHAADVSADGEIGLMYDDTSHSYAFFNRSSQKRIALYYRENNHMTLAEFKNLDTEGEKDYNGNVARTVTINEPLTVAYVAPAKVPMLDGIIDGFLVLRDNSMSTDRVVTPATGQKEFLVKGVGSYFPQNTIKQENYPQNNWLLVQVVRTNADGKTFGDRYHMGDVIKANTVSGMAYHSLPMVLAFNSSLIPEVDTEAEPQTVTYNTYAPGNFNDANLNLNGVPSQTTQYFHMSPKRFEVANITYAVYNNGGMYSDTEQEAVGGFYVDLDGNLANGYYGESDETNPGTPIDQTVSIDDVFSDADNGKAYEFRGVVWPINGWDEDGDDGYDDEFVVVYDIDSNNPVVPNMHAPRNLFKARRLTREISTPANVNANGDVIVQIMEIDATNKKNSSVITGIEDVINADTRTIKAVRYYNVAGMESDKPFDGVNIIVTEFNDGSTTTDKVLK